MYMRAQLNSRPMTSFGLAPKSKNMNQSVSLRSEVAGSHSRSQTVSSYQFLNASRDVTERTEWTNQSTRTRDFIHKLQGVGCPYLDELDESVIGEVIFTPGEARTRILTWLTARLHPSMWNTLVADSSTAISTIPRLTSVLSDAGLCARKDHEMVKGTTSPSKQLQFLDGLVDLVIMAIRETSDHSFDRRMQSVPQQMESCCHLIDDLCRHEDVGTIFPASISLIPPGIALTSGSRGVSRGVDGSKGSSSPSLSELSKLCDQTRSLLEEKQLELENIMQTHTYEELQADMLDNCHRMMAVSLGTLAQQADSFCHSYETEIQPWTNREAPPLSSLGPLCKRVDLLKSQIDKLFQDLEVLAGSFQQLEVLKTSLHTSEEHGNQEQLCASAHRTLKDCLTVLTSLS